MHDFPANIGTSRHENDIIAILARLQRIGLPDNPIALYGSSSFRIWSSVAEDLGSLDIVNLGFGGGTYLSASHYLHQVLVPLKPAKVLLYFGENDIASDGLKAETTLRHLQDLRDRISQALPRADVVVLAIKQSPARWIYRHEFDLFNQEARDWCNSCEHTTWFDPNVGLIGENGLPMFRYYLPDLVHLNGAGYAVWSEALRTTSGLLN
ncbi:lysophospholipase [Rhizobium sp. Leaf311]|uniref:GDSL-type esterase/lipase family protein n=1 Tax=Agrobacterium rosae TaxID=1972867 RepID=A0AAW9FK09_9HYPH|nr:MULTISPECIES: GDSL-type esterase/lipase family protein [Rhizobium/Agrobacterium group]KQO76215.1 lysophospholipase [Rhizobium sp. Leaf262]KQQ44871.1 lysophospholipase [Rhizobium sp. Leaf311]MDX8304887.1 GDSL-type esterase/lipase family protein [Agrobacterium rosae]